jgi:hypothetical protein
MNCVAIRGFRPIGNGLKALKDGANRWLSASDSQEGKSTPWFVIVSITAGRGVLAMRTPSIIADSKYCRGVFPAADSVQLAK